MTKTTVYNYGILDYLNFRMALMTALIFSFSFSTNCHHAQRLYG